MNVLLRGLKAWLLLLVLAGVAGAVYVYSGAYGIGADVPHSKPVAWLLATLRNRAIEAHAADVRVPKLDDPGLIAQGAEHYDEMCSGCHLAPGMHESEIRQGLYPKPPDLTKGPPPDPVQAFWVVKHGVKLTAMPAWGASHDDAELWAIVAFLQKLPELSPEQYRALTGAAAGRHGEGEDHDTAPHDMPTPEVPPPTD